MYYFWLNWGSTNNNGDLIQFDDEVGNAVPYSSLTVYGENFAYDGLALELGFRFGWVVAEFRVRPIRECLGAGKSASSRNVLWRGDSGLGRLQYAEPHFYLALRCGGQHAGTAARLHVHL